MEKSLVPHCQPSDALPIFRSSIPSEHEMAVFNTMADQAATSKMYKGVGEKAGVMMVMLSARELGIPPMQALNGGINIINGKVEISARMMSALIRKAGHTLTTKKCDDTSCTLYGKRWDTGEDYECSFSVAEATKAGLVKPGGGWVKWPSDMCFARALSRLARRLWSDVIGIGYVEGEIKPEEIQVVPCETIYSPKEIIEVEAVDEEKEKTVIRKYLDVFEPDDEYYAIEYLKVVKQHFKWDGVQAVNELLKDPKKLLEKFNTWKSKTTKAE
jgi:hypothetical protein